MILAQGFQIEQPALFVPWRLTETELRHLFGSHSLRHVTAGYHVTSCISLGGLAHELGFHFEPRNNGALVELEFFRKLYPSLPASYREFQKHLELSFGKPTSFSLGPEGFLSCIWTFENISIQHDIFDRFGPEEHVRIKCG